MADIICVPKESNRIPTIKTVQATEIIIPVFLDDLGGVSEVP